MIACAMLMSAEAAALACSCATLPRDPAVRRSFVREAARDAIALVEVERIADADPERHLEQRLRVRRVLAGRAPRTFDVEWRRSKIERGEDLLSLGCGMDWSIGDRTRFTLLYAPEQPRGIGPRFRISSACHSYFLDDRRFRTAVMREVASRR
jgi:hypothetical protein